METIMDSIRVIGRDNARTQCSGMRQKMLVSQTDNLGWLLIQTTEAINVQEALANPDSIFYTYQNW